MKTEKEKFRNKELESAIALCCSQEKLAKKLQAFFTEQEPHKKTLCSQQKVSYWLTNGKGVPHREALALKQLFPSLSLKKLISPSIFQED